MIIFNFSMPSALPSCVSDQGTLLQEQNIPLGSNLKDKNLQHTFVQSCFQKKSSDVHFDLHPLSEQRSLADALLLLLVPSLSAPIVSHCGDFLIEDVHGA